MAAGNLSPWHQCVCAMIIWLLGCQTSSCAAYNNQQSKRLVKYLTTGGTRDSSSTYWTSREGRGAEHSARRLHESSSKVVDGWRASLVNEDHRLHDFHNLTGVERIAQGVLTSRARAAGLDARVRAASYKSQQQKQDRPGRRRMLQSDDAIYKPKPEAFGRKALQSMSPPAPPAASYESAVEMTGAYYSMAFSLGTPPQNLIALADTGSDLVWIQCAACTTCFNQSSPRFDPTMSSTYANLGCSAECSSLGNNQLQCTPNCMYSYTYANNAYTVGNFATETVSLMGYDPGVWSTASSLVPNFRFGCGIQNQGTFPDTGGIVGLARGPISFPSQIAPYLNNTVIFSYCLVSYYLNSTVTSPIIFGPAAVPANATGVSYTPVLTPYETSAVSSYYVNLLAITVGSRVVDIPGTAFQNDANGNGGTVFDSGTRFTLLKTEAYTPVLNEFNTQLSTTYQRVDLANLTVLELCYEISGLQSVDVPNLPNLVFRFDNADLNLPFENTFVVFPYMSRTYMCLGLVEYPRLNVLGNFQQQNFQVVYEEDAMRIGWIPLDCTTL